MHKNLFKILILFSFCQGLLFYIGFEGIIYKFFVLALSYSVIISLVPIKSNLLPRDRILFLFIAYIFVIFISSFINGDSYKDILSYVSFILPGFIVYIFINKAIYNEHEILKINNLFFFIFLFQIFFSVLKLIFWGTSEAVVGTIHFSGGSLNTIVPLVGISMTISFWIFYKRDYRLILIVLGFIFMAWTGEKRGIYFYFSILLIICYIVYNYHNKKYFIKTIFNLLFYMIPILFLTIYIGVKYSPTLNPENIYGGSFNLDYLTDYIITYNTQLDQLGNAAGRFSGLKSVFYSVLNKPIFEMLFGSGPGILLGVGDAEYKVYISYNLSSMIGVNGWSTALISLGFLGAVLVVLFYFEILKTAHALCKLENDSYWMSISFGTFLICIIFFLDFFTYTRSFYHSIPLNITVLYFYSIIKIRYNNLSLK